MAQKKHILIYEPRLGGHHLSWLRYITEDFTAAGLKLTLAVDLRPGSSQILTTYLAKSGIKTKLISAYSSGGGYRGGSKIESLRRCFAESTADEVFMTNFDEIASATLRRAALGIMLPRSLRGRLNGIYFRPRFLADQWRPMGNIVKRAGFTRLIKGGWFRSLYILDEYLIEKARQCWPNCRFHFLPDVWSGDYCHSAGIARQKMELPPDKFIFLNYGIGTRRKGLHLIIRAMLKGELPPQIFLLSAGEISTDRELQNGMAELERRGVARILNHYVSDQEEELCFAACNAVLLPYVKHFGSSGVLSRAAAAGKIVIASEEGLIARRVKEHKLGLLFKSGDIKALRNKMSMVFKMTEDYRLSYKNAADIYAKSCSREMFRAALKEFLD